MQDKYLFISINKHTGWTLTWKCCKAGSLSDDNKKFPILNFEAKIFNDMLQNLEDRYVNECYEYYIDTQNIQEVLTI